MSSPSRDIEEPTSSNIDDESVVTDADASSQRPPAKRPISTAVIEISDTDSDDSDVCAVNSYQASADEVKRIRRDYSSSSSSSDYSSDSESPWEDDSIIVKDKAEPRAVRAHLNLRANRMDDPKLNPELKTQEVLDRVKLHWKEVKDLKSKEITLTSDPFQLCLLHNLLGNSEIINNIVDDMNTLDWSRKKMDLYEFHQTTDLANLTWQRSIRGIYELLKTEVLSLVANVTGMDLRSVSASCSLYGPGDHLLPHDDRLADRRVAFILYLAPWPPPLNTPLINGAEHKRQGGRGGGWLEHMGGALELLSTAAGEGEGVEVEVEGEVARVVRRVLPANNTLAFFAVGSRSFHQVAEVLTMELPRLSINGWFHGPGADPEPPAASLPLEIKPSPDVVVLGQWLDGAYMTPRARCQIQEQMERASEVCLRDFLLPERYQRVLQQLRSPDVEWERCGPTQQRHYHRVCEASKAELVESLVTLAGSATFVRALCDCTGLRLANLSDLELQKWQAGDFRLLPAREAYTKPRLEAVLYLGVPDRVLAGGSTLYVAPEDATDGALVSLPPISNAFNLVYCDAGAASFTKYLSHITMKPNECFYILTCTYSE